MKKIFYFYFFLLCTCLCIYVCCVCLLGGQKRMSDPWNWSYRQLIVAWHGCWGPNTGLLEEHTVNCWVLSPAPILFNYVCVCLCRVCAFESRCPLSQKVSDLQPELQAVSSCQMWALGTDLRSSARAVWCSQLLCCLSNPLWNTIPISFFIYFEGFCGQNVFLC